MRTWRAGWAVLVCCIVLLLLQSMGLRLGGWLTVVGALTEAGAICLGVFDIRERAAAMARRGKALSQLIDAMAAPPLISVTATDVLTWASTPDVSKGEQDELRLRVHELERRVAILDQAIVGHSQAAKF